MANFWDMAALPFLIAMTVIFESRINSSQSGQSIDRLGHTCTSCQDSVLAKRIAALGDHT